MKDELFNAMLLYLSRPNEPSEQFVEALNVVKLELYKKKRVKEAREVLALEWKAMECVRRQATKDDVLNTLMQMEEKNG